MSQKCKCASSRMFPHRADKCLLASKHKKSDARTSEPVSAANSPLENASDGDVAAASETERQLSTDLLERETITAPPVEVDTLEELCQQSPSLVLSLNGSENLRVSSENPSIDSNQETITRNATLPNGNDPCDCVMSRVSKHRKNKCAWKTHAAVGLVAAAVTTVAIGSVVLLANSDTEDVSDIGTDELSVGVSHLNLSEEPPAPTEATPVEAAPQNEEVERLRAEREAMVRATEERVRLLEAEQARLLKAQQEHIAAQGRANQQLHNQLREAQRANREYAQTRAAEVNVTYNQQSYRIYNTQHNSYSSSITNAPSYNRVYRGGGGGGSRTQQVGTTLRGTPCKNCLKQGTRCHQHR